MNNELRLLSKVLDSRDVTPLFDNGVKDSWFVDPEVKRVWVFVREHFAKYAECPSLDVIHKNFPTWKQHESQDSINYLIDSVVASRRAASVLKMMESAATVLDSSRDHEEALRIFQSGIVGLEEDGLGKTHDLNLVDEPQKRWDEYTFRKNNPGLLGTATGFPSIDQVTGGLQPGQLIVIVAPPKTGKSTVALQIAQNVHLQDKSVMFQSFEMSNHEQQTRYDAMRARISHTRLINGLLEPEEEARYQAKLRSMENMRKPFWLVDSANGSTVSGIASKISVLHPDVVFIDGVYLMIDEQTGEANTPQAITNITRSLKRMAQKYKVPVVITTQVLNWKMRKGQVTADSIGYSSSFHQDADVIFGLQREDENVDDTRILKVLESRNSGRMEIALIWDWSTGTFREIDVNDI
jgi:replicative DNA helicase